MEGRTYGCGVEVTLAVIGGKWKAVILYYLLGGTRRFGEFRRLLPDVTQKMLTAQLRELERDGLVHREVYREVPPEVEYSPTPLGQSLEPIPRQLNGWGKEYAGLNAETRQIRKAVEAARTTAQPVPR